jgi:starch-binding outer membrane protein, SusD/RagB family
MLSAVALLTGSCEVLDKEPTTSIAPERFFKSDKDAEAGLTAVYDGLQATGCYSQDLHTVGEMPSDNCTSTNGDVLALDNLTWFSTSGQIYNIYRDQYLGINRANAVLKYVPGIEMASDRKAQILGEARFLRALYYFNLVRYYGGVPLRLEPTESGTPAAVALPRATPEAVYAQITADLAEAENAVSRSVNPRRVSKGAVNALQARVYLTMREWSNAQQAAAKVLTAGYSLMPSFKTLFPADNKNESILEVQNSGAADGNNILPDLLLPSPPATYSFPKFNIPTRELIQLADTTRDQRWKLIGTTDAGRDHASYVYGTRTGNDKGPFVYKWPGPPNGFNSPDNTYILRLAEVLLIYAEATNELSGPTGDAFDKLNQVRTRAGLTALTSADISTKEAMRTEIDLQRRLELAFEGERWPDLLRYARHEQADASAQHTVTALDIIQQKKGTPDVNYLLLPLPQQEILTNAQLRQNPGY